MEQISIIYGNTKAISISVSDDKGNLVDLSRGKYKLLLDNKVIPFEVKGENNSEMLIVIQGKDFLSVGTHSLTLYENMNEDWQMRCPLRDCIKITRY